MKKLTLNCLSVGDRARVRAIKGESGMHRRFLDLGLIPGTTVFCLGKSPSGDPAAYRIRGAVIAIRARDASAITVQREEMLP